MIHCPKISEFTMHGSSGQSVRHDAWPDWVLKHQNNPGASESNGYGLGQITHHSWRVGDTTIRVLNDKWIYSSVLPDASGFIGFEQKRWAPDNCLLLDAYGKPRLRLIVPWELTRNKNPESAKPPTSFENVSAPYENPADGKLGEFGVTAWVEHAGKYYFELDYHTGQFLWGREIRD